MGNQLGVYQINSFPTKKSALMSNGVNEMIFEGKPCTPLHVVFVFVTPWLLSKHPWQFLNCFSVFVVVVVVVVVVVCDGDNVFLQHMDLTGPPPRPGYPQANTGYQPPGPPGYRAPDPYPSQPPQAAAYPPPRAQVHVCLTRCSLSM